MHRDIHLDRIDSSRLQMLTAICLTASLLTTWTVNASAEDTGTQEIVITATTALVKDGERIVGRVNRGQRFQVLKTNGDWYLVELTVDGTTTKGWIYGNEATVVDTESTNTLQITAEQQQRLLKKVRALAENRDRLRQEGRFNEAIQPQKEILDISEQVLGKDHHSYASGLNSLATLNLKLGDYATALSLVRQAMDIQKKSLLDTHPDYATSLNNLAAIYHSIGNYAKAGTLYERALEIERKALGEWHPEYAASLNNLAAMYWQMADYAKAEPLLIQARDIYRRAFGESHPDYATSLNNLASLYSYQRDYAKAAPLYIQALKIQKQVLGETHPSFALTLNNTALMLTFLENYADAEPLLIQARDIQKQLLGDTHPDYATSLNNLALLYDSMGKQDQAEPLYIQSLEILEQTSGEMHPSYAATLHSLVLLTASTGRWLEAASFQEKGRRAIRRQIDRVLPGLSNVEQLNFLNATDQSKRSSALSLGLTCKNDAEIPTLSAGWLLNGKAVAQQAVAERIQLSRDSRDPKLSKLVQELQSVRTLLAQTSLSSPAPGQQSQHQSRFAELSRREQSLSKQLRQAQGDVVRDDPWVEVEEVRRSLAAESVLVDISHFQVQDFHAPVLQLRWQEPHYVAWIIPAIGHGEIKIVDLGGASVIENAVHQVRAGLDDPTEGILDRGEPEIEQEFREPLQHLASLVLDPLLAEVGEAKHLILSPDASLWLVPWAALPLKDGRYAVEEYRIHYVISGRDLVTGTQQAQLATSRPLIMADPDFDLDPAQANVETLALLDAPLELRSSGSMDKLQPVRRLTATATEAKEITPSLQRYCQAEPRVFTGAQALEGVFKSASRPKVVTLSTHGFFFDDQRTRPDDRMDLAETQSAVLTVDGDPLENPLLRCGLLLAGCNQRDKATEGQDDGVLTGLEIVGTDLRGTELVVLSACETGIGDVQNGEGVAGLRQAFQLAGARSVVASLWRVPDVATGQVMRDFFDELADGQTKSDALRNSQLAHIASRRKLTGAAHPFFWAAFTLTGN